MGRLVAVANGDEEPLMGYLRVSGSREAKHPVELGELGSEHGQLARQLQERLDDVDMEGMQTLLDQMSDA